MIEKYVKKRLELNMGKSKVIRYRKKIGEKKRQSDSGKEKIEKVKELNI